VVVAVTLTTIVVALSIALVLNALRQGAKIATRLENRLSGVLQAQAIQHAIPKDP